MPFKSSAQRAYLYIHHPAVAKEFAAKTPKGAHLPKHVTHVSQQAKRQGQLEALRKQS